jgi:hypothetical protein
MLLSQIPELYFDINYIPADLLFKNREYPQMLKIRGRYWYLNIETALAYYEKIT